jgi:hypothetical protein
MENWFLIVGVILCILVFEGIFLYRKHTAVKETLPYKKKDSILHAVEKEVFDEITSLLPSSYILFPQVVLSNLVTVTAPKKEFWGFMNKVNKKTIDFVVCTKKDFSPVLAIEYDGRMHQKKERKERDRFVDTVLFSAKMPILHIPHTRERDLAELKKQILEKLSLS